MVDDRQRRALFTLAVIAALWAASAVWLPGLDREVVRDLGDQGFLGMYSAGRGSVFSVMTLGLSPFVSAFLVVEVLALIVPRWRLLRVGGPGDRLFLTRIAMGLAVVIIAIQGMGMALGLEQIRIGSEHLALEPGLGFRIVTVATLGAGSALWLWGARLIDRHGIGNGFVVLLVTGWVRAAVGHLAGLEPEMVSPMSALLAVGATAAGVVATRALLIRYTPDGTLRLSVAGVVPASDAAGLMMMASATVMTATSIEWLQPGRVVYLAGNALLALVLTVFYASIFHRPERVLAATGMSEPRVRAALAVAMKWSFGYSLLLVGLPHLLLQSHFPFAIGAVQVAILTAVAMDLADEWEARRELPDLVPVWPIHRVFEVDTRIARLEDAGIPTRVRSLRYRSLLHFFGPWAPIEILVPRARAAEAVALLEAR